MNQPFLGDGLYSVVLFALAVAVGIILHLPFRLADSSPGLTRPMLESASVGLEIDLTIG